MQLEDMKSAWNEMNRRLEKSEITNQKMISKMILSRARSGFEKLVRYERLFLFFSLFAMAYLALPLVITIYGLPSIVILEIILLYCVGEQAYKVYILRKIHLDTDNVQELIGKMLAYRSLTMFMFKIGMFVLLPIILVAMFLPLLNQPDKLPVLAGAAVGAVIGFVLGISAFRRHKREIEDVIGELNELESYLNEQ
ncbi:MAG: hypothetical protein RR202_11565 [Bacteroidales bacterium]